MAELRYMKGARFQVPTFHDAVCTCGVFDGVHRGHRFLIKHACFEAQRLGKQSVILTFDRDPSELFLGARLKKIMTNDQRLAALSELAVDRVAVMHFDSEFAAQTPYEFLDALFSGDTPYALHVGCDFRFGAQARGTVEDLQSWGDAHSMKVRAHDLKGADGIPISSSRIRELLLTGDIEGANNLLGYPYRLEGKVQPGRKEGRTFGFRTANMVVDDTLRVLGDGVYAAYAYVDNVRYKAAVSVGVAPTFADQTTSTCEVHLIDFHGDLYGKTLSLEFMHWLRPMMKFTDKEVLIRTVKDNIEWARTHL